jgi:hypothetical protein
VAQHAARERGFQSAQAVPETGPTPAGGAGNGRLIRILAIVAASALAFYFLKRKLL